MYCCTVPFATYVPSCRVFRGSNGCAHAGRFTGAHYCISIDNFGIAAVAFSTYHRTAVGDRGPLTDISSIARHFSPILVVSDLPSITTCSSAAIRLLNQSGQDQSLEEKRKEPCHGAGKLLKLLALLVLKNLFGHSYFSGWLFSVCLLVIVRKIRILVAIQLGLFEG
jgi:hypothetical protein